MFPKNQVLFPLQSYSEVCLGGCSRGIWLCRGISGGNVVGGQGDELLRSVNGQEPILPGCP